MKKIVFCMVMATFSTLVTINVEAAAMHPIVIQISPPRSLSTVSMRMWQARNDFTVMNEHFTVAYFIDKLLHQEGSATELIEEWYHSSPLRTFEQVYESLIAKAANGPVFVKEMSFALFNYLNEHHEIMSDPNMHFLFLIRNPQDVICSFYLRLGYIIDDFTSLIGYKACYEILDLVDRFGTNKPYIVCADELCHCPAKIAQAMCNALSIPFSEQILHWKNLGASFTGQTEWCELKKPHMLYAWHEQAITSTGLTPIKTYDADAEGNPTFIEISNEEDRAACFAAYLENLPFYKLILSYKQANQVN